MEGRRWIAALALAAGLGGCGSILDGVDACTLIGCASGLHVTLAAPPPGPVRIEVTDAATGSTRAIDCAAGGQCTGALLQDFFPTRVTVRVTTASGTSTQSFTPRYTLSRPNGDDCPPVCRQAVVRVSSAA